MLGLDVSASSVKLVELGQDKSGNLILECCAIVPLERGWINDGNIEKFDEVADALKRLIKKSGTKTKNVAMALPPSAVITKKIVLPGGMTDHDLEMQVESEANQYIPFPLDEVSLDFCILGPSANATGDVDVLIAASRREKVQDLQGLAEAAGLKPAIVDVKSYASRLAASRLISSMPGHSAERIVALFEVGSLTTSMQVIRNDEVLYDRDQAFGGAQLTQLIVRQYGFSPEEAETKKCSGDLPEDYRSTVLQPFIESLVQEIGRALQVLQGCSRLQVEFFLGVDFVLGSNPQHVAGFTHAQALGLENDVKRLVPRHVLQTQGDGAGNGIRRDDVEVGKVCNDLQQGTHIDALEVQRQFLAAVTRPLGQLGTILLHRLDFDDELLVCLVGAVRPQALGLDDHTHPVTRLVSGDGLHRSTKIIHIKAAA
jgi:type IV pilus assembly protein PilM